MTYAPRLSQVLLTVVALAAMVVCATHTNLDNQTTIVPALVIFWVAGMTAGLRFINKHFAPA